MAATGEELQPVLGSGDISLQMIGKQQVQNAAAASTMIQVLNAKGHAMVSQAHVRAGLARAYLPGRFSLTLQGPEHCGAALGDVETMGCILLLACHHMQLSPTCRSFRCSCPCPDGLLHQSNMCSKCGS